MSPEQARGTRAVDHRSDLWALGVIACQCLTGRRPFEGAQLGDLLLRICAEPIPVPSTLGPVPPGFDAWFARATERDPDRRFQSATEMAEALRAICGVGATSPGASLPPPASAPAPSLSLAPAPPARSSSHGVLVLVLGLLALGAAVVVAVGVVFWLVRSDDPPSPVVSAATPVLPAPAPTPSVSAEPVATETPKKSASTRSSPTKATGTATSGSGEEAQTPAEKIKAAEQKIKAAEDKMKAAEEKLKGLEGE
jgi:serine/threonine-protein kinase